MSYDYDAHLKLAKLCEKIGHDYKEVHVPKWGPFEEKWFKRCEICGKQEPLIKN